ncbi:hypothetical protein RB593_009129 [Gaeumannomyces tritici]
MMEQMTRTQRMKKKVKELLHLEQRNPPQEPSQDPLKQGPSREPVSRTEPKAAPTGPVGEPAASPPFPDGVKVLHDCPDATVDICFVHGLTGNRDSTWTADGHSTPWPGTLLSQKLKNARILTYGYDAYVLRRSVASNNRLSDHAKNFLNDLTTDRASCEARSRPLIFVAHSLGGLVCKEAILHSRNHPEPHLRNIFDCTKGIIFMGTPHKGSWMADWGQISAKAVGLVKSTNKSLMEILETKDQFLESIQGRFLDMIREQRESGRRLEVTCFFEELPLPVAGTVVPKESATFEGFTSISIHANHRDMVKFSSEEENGFKRLLGELSRWVAQVASDFELPQVSQDRLRSLSPLPSTLFGPGNRGQQVGQNYGTMNTEIHFPPERPETPPQPFATIPFSRDPDFVDRGDILDQLLQRCSEPAGRMALVGLGGIGKSQLAIEFAHRAAEKTPNKWIFWIHAGTQARVEEGFQAIADVVKLPGRNQPKADVLQLVYGWLSNEQNGRWTIILDSADNGGVFYATNDGRKGKPLANYLPQSRNGSIVVTTRNRDLAFRLTGDHKNIIDIKPMVLADALLLLKKKLGPLPDTDTAKALVQALDLVPLAISQAAAYIQARSPLSSVGKYLAEFQKGEYKRTRLLSHDAGDLRRDGGASNAILTTWQISFEHIRSERPSAADLLALMSFFDRQGIALSLLKPLNTENVQWDSGSESGSSSDEADDGFEDDVAILRGFCLVSASENASAASEDAKALEMHGLVQLSMRQWLEADGLQNKFRRQFVERIAAAFPTGDYSNWATCQKLFAHVDAAMNCRPTEEGTQELWAGLMYRGGWYALEQGKYGAAEQMVGKSKRSREKQLGNSDEKTLNSVALYAEIFRNQGRWQEAEKLEVEVMETRKTKLGVDHPDTLTSMANLASTFWNQGRWEEAEKLEVEVMETRKTKLGVDHPDTLTSMANLASTFWNQGRWEEAEKLQVEVMETRKTKLGVDHPDTLRSMNNLASTFWNQGRWEEAEKLNVEVMETRKTKLGVDHPDTLRSMNNLASTFWNQGRWEEAEKLNVEVMETRKTKLGVDHPDTLTSMANLASTFWNQGRWEEAEKLQVEVMETRKTKLGVDHPDTLTSMANLASTFWNQGRWEEAEKLEVEVMETRKTKLGVDHPDTLTSMANLASTFWNQGRWEEAEKLQVEVMETRKTKLGVDHPDTLRSMNNLASTFWNQGRWEEAEKLNVEVMETRKTKLGVDHPSTLTSMANLALTWKSQGRWQEAEKLQVEVMETSKTKLGVDHPDTLTSMANLASTFWNQGRWEEAEKLQVEVMETRKTKLGVDHPSTLTSMANLALTWKSQGRWQEAEKLNVEVMETRKTKLGVDHPDTLTSMNNLAFTWKSQGRHKDALALMKHCAQTRQRVLGLKHPDTVSSLSVVTDWTS